MALAGFAISFVYYLCVTLIFEFISFAQFFNERFSKIEDDIHSLSFLETISARTRFYVSLFIARFL